MEQAQQLPSVQPCFFSVVIPVYGCSHCLSELNARLHATLSTLTDNYEIILVNDASPDDAWAVIQALARKDQRTKGINLSRNFGQHYAITAGLEYASGQWIVVMDCDLQDQPEEILKLYRKAQEGFQVVVGLRAQRQHGFFRKFASRLFYRLFRYFTGSTVDERFANFGVYSNTAIRSIRALKEQNRSFGLFALWVGFKRAEIEIEHAPRLCGNSSYTFARMMQLALGSIVAHSNKLLLLSVKLGFLLAASALVWALWLVVRYFVWVIESPGWTSLMVSLYFTTGLIILTIGIVGLYVGKIFDEVKQRPLYIVESTTFDKKFDGRSD